MIHSVRRRSGLTQRQVVFALALAGSALVLTSSYASRLFRSRQVAPDIAAEAQDYLRQRNVKPLDVDLDKLLVEAQRTSIPTLPHPLLNQAAPDFQLSDNTGRLRTLSEHLEHGPVVVVFYYGYYCNHCVSQLFALNDDLAKFHELGAEVLAISADTPAETSEKFAKYGMFAFPVLSDPENKVATAYSVFVPPTLTKPESLLHGTFVIDRGGVVRWCHYDRAPFTANATLLVELAKTQGRLTEKSP